MAVLSAILGGLAAAGAIAGTATSIKASRDAKKASNPAPAFDAEKEKAKAAEQEANANKKRIEGETNTHMTSALGNTEGTVTQKKTILGG